MQKAKFNAPTIWRFRILLKKASEPTIINVTKQERRTDSQINCFVTTKYKIDNSATHQIDGEKFD